ncbi:MAG: methyl-accepting chemotaxis protein [Spirochaetota bacterium]
MSDKRKVSMIRGVGGKILIIFVSVTVVGVATLAIVAANRASTALRESSVDQMRAVREIKSNQIQSLFEQLDAETDIIALSGDVDEALEDLLRYREEMDVDATGPYDITGTGDELTLTYEEIYDETYDKLSVYTEVAGHYDLYLVSEDHGHVMYTNARESDLGTNLATGPHRDSALARVWELARETDKPVVVDMEPYAPSNNRPAMFYAQRVKNDDGEAHGIAVIQVALGQINTIMQERTGMGETGETYLVGEDKLMRSDSYRDPEARSVSASLNGTVGANGVDTQAVREAFAGRPGSDAIVDYNGNPVFSAWDVVGIRDFEWALIAEIDEAEVQEPINELVAFILYIAVALMVVVIVVSVLFSRSISRPLSAAAGIASQIAEGNLAVEVPETRRKDEIGLLTGSFKTMARSLNNVLGQVDESVDQVNSGAEQVAQSSQSLSQGSTEQASSLEEITASLNEINSQSDQNAESATEASSVAKGALDSAEKGNEQVQSLVAAMDRINESSDEITKVVKVIDDIAFQINLLALNANVEAARAGKYGKGFAVVAEEVRNLAVRSAQAAKETTTMVETTTKNIQEGNTAAQATSEQLQEIVTGSTKVADFLEEIALASKEQAQGVEQINQGLSQVDQVTQSNTANAEESAAAAEELSAQAQQLRALVSTFQLAHNKMDAREARASGTTRAANGRDGNGSHGEQPRQIAAGPSSPEYEPAGAAHTRPAEKSGQNPRDAIKLDDDDFGQF